MNILIMYEQSVELHRPRNFFDLFLFVTTDRGISRTKFLKEGENCNAPALTETLIVLGVGFEHNRSGISCIELQDVIVLLLFDWLKF